MWLFTYRETPSIDSFLGLGLDLFISGTAPLIIMLALLLGETGAKPWYITAIASCIGRHEAEGKTSSVRFSGHFTISERLYIENDLIANDKSIT